MVKTVGLNGYSDVHYTDESVALRIIGHFRPTGKCLEPFRGGGAFYRHLPEGATWCELADGKDFFAHTEICDWIVTNPPFSNLTLVFEHAFRLSNHCVFLIPISKYWSSAPRIKLAKEYGGLREILHCGTGRDIGFNIGFPFAAMHFERGYSGPIHEDCLVF